MMLIGSTLTQFGIVFLFATLMGIHVGKKAQPTLQNQGKVMMYEI